MTEVEAKDLFGPFEQNDEEKVTPEKRMGGSAVDHPAHYNGGDIECIDAIKSAVQGLNGFEGFCAGNAIKYLWRWKAKGGKTDLKKAAWYIDRLSTVGGKDAG